MKKYINKWLIPICLLFIICTQFFMYYTKQKINTGLWAMVVLMIPAALKGFEVNVSKYLEQLLRIIGLLLIIYTVFITIW